MGVEYMKIKVMKTAVEWLILEIQRHNDAGYEFRPKYNEELIQQVIKMEKMQIETSFKEGMFHHTNGLCPDEYYNETFKSE